MHLNSTLLQSVLKLRMVNVTVGLLLAFTGCLQSFAQTKASDETLLYGFLGYSPNLGEDTDLGLYTITADGETTRVWTDKTIGATGTYTSVMWPQDGELHALFGNQSTFFHLIFDFETGDLLEQIPIDVSGDNAYKYIRRGAYNPNDGHIYGYSWNADETQDYFVKTPASDPSQVTIVREMPKDFVACSSNCFNPEDNCMYGVDIYRSLIRVDVHGNFSYTNLLTQSQMDLHGVVSGMVYAPKDKCFYWNARYQSYSSEFVKIDPKNTKEVEVNGVKETYIVTESVKWFNKFDAFVSFFTFDSTGSVDGPVAPETVSYDFAEGATTGSIVYRMPTKLANGDAAPESMKWEATASEVASGEAEVSSGFAAPGEEVTVKYENLESGEYTFWFRAYSGDIEGELNVNTTWVGPDVPAVPTGVTFEPTGKKDEYVVKWNPVTTGAHDGYLNKEDVTYKVFLNGQTLIATVKNTEATVEIESEEDMMSCYVVVYAIANNKASEPGYSRTIFIGDGWELPYSIVPTTLQVEMMTYINPEGDDLGWRPFICPPNTPTFYTGNSEMFRGNDWLITPPLKFPDKDEIYEISYYVALWDAALGEDYYEIWLGTEPTEEGIQGQQLLEKTQPGSMAFEKKSVFFKVPEAGSYYIGFRCVSEPAQGGVLLCRINIEDTGTGEVSDALSDDVVIIGGKGSITVKGGENMPVAVYALDGARVFSGVAGVESVISLNPGMYIVVCDGVSRKVVVK